MAAGADAGHHLHEVYAPAQLTPRSSGAIAISPELAALRRHGSVIRAAEQELNLSHKSRTLSNHLRGICLQALSEQEWDVQRAAEFVAASDDPRQLGKLKAKMRRYLDTISDNVAAGGESKLYNNLPAAYHPALARAISRARAPGRNNRT